MSGVVFKMSKPVILNKEVLSLSEVKHELKTEFKKDDEESENSNFRVNKLMEYLNDFVKLNSSDAKKLKKDILDLKVPRLKEEHVSKIIDFLPTLHDEIKVVLQQFPVTVSSENMDKIISVVKKYKEKIKESKKHSVNESSMETGKQEGLERSEKSEKVKEESKKAAKPTKAAKKSDKAKVTDETKPTKVSKASKKVKVTDETESTKVAKKSKSSNKSAQESKK